jgi:hypothetical protein
MHTRERERERVTWSNEVEEHESIVFEVIVSDSMVCRFYWRERERERERERNYPGTATAVQTAGRCI